MHWDVQPLTGVLVDEWFHKVIRTKGAAFPDAETCENVAIVLNNGFLLENNKPWPRPPWAEEFLPDLPPVYAVPEKVLRRRREAIRFLKETINLPQNYTARADLVEDLALKKLKTALDDAEPYLVGPKQKRGRPSGPEGRPWLILAICAAEVVKAVLVEAGNKNPGTTRNSQTVGFVELLVKYWGHDVQRDALAIVLREVAKDEKK